MDLKVKVERAKKAIASISQHDDASKEDVEVGLSELVNFIADEEANGLAGREKRIEVRAKARNEKLLKKRAAKDAK